MSFVLWLLCASALFYLIRKLTHRMRVLKYVRKIPTYPTLPILGQILYYKGPEEILNGLQQVCTEFGPTFRVTVFWKEGVFLSDPAYVELVLGSTKLLHKSKEYDKLDGWLGTGLLTAGPSAADKWKKTRRIITPTFHFQILEDFIDIFDICSNTLLAKLKERAGESSVDVSEYISLCTLDVICETAMGTKVNAQVNSDSKYVSCVKDMSRIITEQIYSAKRLPLFFYLSGDGWRQKKNLKVLHDYTETVIRSRRKEIAGHVIGGKKRLAFLDLLIQSTIDGRPMTDDEIRQEVDTFMFEGHDTTSTAINSVLYCLAFHQDVQEKVFKEIKGIFGEDKSKPLAFNDLQNMRYLEMVIKETLRLYPPVPIFGRCPQEDIQIGDLIIPKEVDVIIFTWGLHRNPAVYPDPEMFYPERFTLQNQDLRNPFSYVPFSAGPRNCIGQRFAILEIKTVVSKLLRNFEILPVRDFQPIWVPDVVLKSVNGMQVRLKDRL